MKIISYVFPVLSLLLLAAHFSRNNIPYLPILFLLLPLLLFVKKLWVKWVLEIALYLGSIAWVISIFHYVHIRISNNQNWIRLAIILGAVALFTFFSGFLFEFKYLKNIYKN